MKNFGNGPVWALGGLLCCGFLGANHTGVYTWHNDIRRTGQNLLEKKLKPGQLNSTHFGKLFSVPVDGALYAQPLYVAGVDIPGQGRHNVVYAATENDSVYAFDADHAGEALWHASFTDGKTVTAVSSEDVQCRDLRPRIGITGTPVIDPASGILYVVAKTKERLGSVETFVQRLHALDIRTGREKLGGPVTIEVKGSSPFNALRENQRPALLLSHGIVYIGFASYCDQEPYHGWLLGYEASTLRQVMAYNATPKGTDGGIWQSGGGPAADAKGDLFFITGNGTFDAHTGGPNYGDSFIRLSTAGIVADYFTPHDQEALSQADLDLGSAGQILLPDQAGPHPHEMISSGKNSAIYLVDRDHMGHFQAESDSQIVQAIPDAFSSEGFTGGVFTAPVLWKDLIYFGAVGCPIETFRLQNGLLTKTPVMQSSSTYAFPGAAMSVSADGDHQGILWALEISTGSARPAILHAYDAADLTKELYRSDQAGSRDELDVGVKFTSPTIVDGKVYVAGQSRLTVLGFR